MYVTRVALRLVRWQLKRITGLVDCNAFRDDLAKFLGAHCKGMRNEGGCGRFSLAIGLTVRTSALLQ